MTPNRLGLSLHIWLRATAALVFIFSPYPEEFGEETFVCSINIYIKKFILSNDANLWPALVL